jgi:hypothetical protein
MRNHNEEMKKRRIAVEWKPTEAENFREKFALAGVSESVELRNGRPFLNESSLFLGLGVTDSLR